MKLFLCQPLKENVSGALRRVVIHQSVLDAMEARVRRTDLLLHMLFYDLPGHKPEVTSTMAVLCDTEAFILSFSVNSLLRAWSKSQ